MVTWITHSCGSNIYLNFICEYKSDAHAKKITHAWIEMTVFYLLALTKISLNAWYDKGKCKFINTCYPINNHNDWSPAPYLAHAKWTHSETHCIHNLNTPVSV